MFPEEKFMDDLEGLGVFSEKVEDDGLGHRLSKKWVR